MALFYVQRGAIRPVVSLAPNWGNIIQGDPVTLMCNCRISAGDISDPITLNVTNTYLILQRPPSAIYEGDPLTLRCHHNKDYWGFETQFYKDNKEIKSQVTDSEFHVDKVDLNTTGHYRCTKQISSPDYSDYTESSDEFSVSVKELFPPPEIKVTPYRVKEGGDMTVTCDTRPDPLRGGTKLQFAFYRDGRNVQEFNVSDTYRVRSAQLEDSGNYTCEVKTVSGTVKKMSDGFYIIIIKSEYLKPGLSSSLFFVGNATKNELFNFGSIVFTKLYFTSTTQHGVGHRGHTSIAIQLFCSPKIKVTPWMVIEGGSMAVTCDTRLNYPRGGTKLRFAFYRDGRTVQEFSESKKYRVRSAQLEDSGDYTCEVMTASDTVKKMGNKFKIQIYSRTFFISVLTLAVVGGLLLIVLSAGLIWRCKKRKESSASSQELPQERIAMGNNVIINMEGYLVLFKDI
ncbi:high affinity immunoglobulin gamma Fc receptor I-like [Pyxicephalus adspersus]|uniref:high affinity immunoglobulin gamma Fc receptor I-like n=1 Tax=Pyxicephalus adspersus TaxID=30357 RepID=UPI003B5A24B1